MKSAKKVIHIVKHNPTGAIVPVVINKMTPQNVIEDFQEVFNKRRYFTVKMLENRWDKCKEDVIELLQKYQVPGHLRHEEVKNIAPPILPIDVAMFFEEYIVKLELKEKMPHNKLKSKRYTSTLN